MLWSSACFWTLIVDYPFNKHCIWILNLSRTRAVSWHISYNAVKTRNLHFDLEIICNICCSKYLFAFFFFKIAKFAVLQLQVLCGMNQPMELFPSDCWLYDHNANVMQSRLFLYSDSDFWLGPGASEFLIRVYELIWIYCLICTELVIFLFSHKCNIFEYCLWLATHMQFHERSILIFKQIFCTNLVALKWLQWEQWSDRVLLVLLF